MSDIYILIYWFQWSLSFFINKERIFKFSRTFKPSWAEGPKCDLKVPSPDSRWASWRGHRHRSSRSHSMANLDCIFQWILQSGHRPIQPWHWGLKRCLGWASYTLHRRIRGAVSHCLHRLLLNARWIATILSC